MKVDAWSRYRQGETASKATAVAKDYHQPDYWEERWRSVDEEFLKVFPDKSGDKGHTYLGTDVTQGWTWNHGDTTKTRQKLDDLVAKRGDAAHRSRVSIRGAQNGHFIRRGELEKAIKFLRTLVEKTDGALNQESK